MEGFGHRNSTSRTRVRFSDRVLSRMDVISRTAMAANPRTPVELLSRLADDDMHRVRIAVARNPSTSPALLTELARSTNFFIQLGVARNPSTPVEVLRSMALNKSYSISSRAREQLMRREAEEDALYNVIFHITEANLLGRPRVSANALAKRRSQPKRATPGRKRKSDVVDNNRNTRRKDRYKMLRSFSYPTWFGAFLDLNPNQALQQKPSRKDSLRSSGKLREEEKRRLRDRQTQTAKNRMFEKLRNANEGFAREHYPEPLRQMAAKAIGNRSPSYYKWSPQRRVRRTSSQANFEN